MTLSDYLLSAARRRFDPGKHDCCTFPADWCLSQGHADPMSAWRGKYRSAARAAALIKRDGGLVEMFTAGFALAGLPEADDPRRGDVGVLATATEDGSEHVGGIYTGKRWAVLAMPSGILLTEARAVRCWRV